MVGRGFASGVPKIGKLETAQVSAPGASPCPTVIGPTKGILGERHKIGTAFFNAVPILLTVHLFSIGTEGFAYL